MAAKDRSPNLLNFVSASIGAFGPVHRNLAPPRPYLVRPAAGHVRCQPLVRFPDSKILRLEIALCALLTACISFSVVVGHLGVGPVQEPSSGLNQCSDTPCFRGLIPGQTNWPDAIAAFGGLSTLSNDVAWSKVMLFPSPQNDKLAAIMLERPLNKLTTGAILMLYGKPSCLAVSQNNGALIFHYSGVHVMTRPINNLFNPLTPIAIIILGNPEDPLNHPPPPCQASSTSGQPQQGANHPWHGFATLDFYTHGD